MQAAMEFGVLGPLHICVRGTAVPVRAAKQRALIAALILHANRTVVVDELSDVLWDERPPHDARGAIQAYVMRLRQQLDGKAGRELIHTVPGGYLLEAGDEAVDLKRFRQLTRQAERSAAAGMLPDASGYFAEALELWRGPPLVDVDSDWLHRSEIPMLREQRLLAEERRLEIELALGHHRDVIARLNMLVAAYPLRERYWHMLMMALHQSGWRADALAVYRRARQMFREELGIEPGEGLRDLHEAVLTARPLPVRPEAGAGGRSMAALRGGPGEQPAGHAAPACQGAHGPAGRVPDGQPPLPDVDDGPPAEQVAGHPGTSAGSQPYGCGRRESSWISQCQLPREAEGFAGRTSLVSQVTAELCAGGQASPLVVLSGRAGVGKSALAIRVAHRVRRHFPDGQLYVHLGEAGQHPERLGALIADLMLVTGRERGSFPDRLDQRAAAFRAWLADRKVLLVIEDVMEAGHVLPLLPGTAGCAVLVTSREDLHALTVLYGAHHHVVPPLAADEARELLESLLGGRAATEQAAAAELVAQCHYLPLALRIAAAGLAGQPGLRLETYLASLRRHVPPARPEDTGAAAAQADASSDRLAAVLQRFLDLLSLRAGPDFTASEVAALLGNEPGRPAHLPDQPRA